MAVPYTFGSATTSIPLSQLDSNFATGITLGNTVIQLGNTVTTLNNMTMANVTISSGTSNIQTNVANATGVLIEANGGTGTTTGYYGFKNRIINGAMVIDQRNAGASYTATTANGYCLDRWQTNSSVSSKYTVQQNAGSVTPPAGFANYLGVTSSAATTVASGDYYYLTQVIEGYNFSDLAWGTANAKTITLSFQVYSSLTGTFGGSLQNGTQGRSYPFTYTISSANTWTTILITIAGDTSGTWIGNTNGRALYLVFSLGMGSTYSGTAGSWSSNNYLSATGATSVVGTNGATFYITGVQLEKGSTATSFDYRPYGTELALCQRYFESSGDATSAAGTTGQFSFGNGGVTTGAILMYIPFIVPKRASPTVTIYDGNTGTINQITRTTPGIGSQQGQTASTQGNNTRGVQVYSSSGNSHSGIAFYWKSDSEL